MSRLTDAETRARMARTGQAARVAFATAVNQLRLAVGSRVELVTWVAPKQVGENGWTFGRALYARVIDDVFLALEALVDEAGLGDLWIEPSQLPDSARAVDGLSLWESMALVVTIWHGERISEGLIAGCLEDGTLLAAAARVSGALRATD